MSSSRGKWQDKIVPPWNGRSVFAKALTTLPEAYMIR
jgi:hypothetical protein